MKIPFFLIVAPRISRMKKVDSVYADRENFQYWSFYRMIEESVILKNWQNSREYKLILKDVRSKK